jgi:hypothetical protein
MNRAIVEEKVDVPTFVTVQDEAQKLKILNASFAIRQKGSQSSANGIQRTEDRDATILTGRRHLTGFADRPPHPAQAGIKMEFAFVFKQEDVSVGVTGDFFKAASRSRRARRTSRRFCLCRRDNFGRL